MQVTGLNQLQYPLTRLLSRFVLLEYSLCVTSLSVAFEDVEGVEVTVSGLTVDTTVLPAVILCLSLVVCALLLPKLGYLGKLCRPAVAILIPTLPSRLDEMSSREQQPCFARDSWCHLPACCAARRPFRVCPSAMP